MISSSLSLWVCANDELVESNVVNYTFVATTRKMPRRRMDLEAISGEGNRKGERRVES